MQAEIIKSYQVNPDDLPPIEKQKEFNSIRNQIIGAALSIQKTENPVPAATSIISLLNQLSKIIYDSYRSKHKKAFGVDHKIKSAIQEKREAHGIRGNGEETQQNGDYTQSM